MANNESTVSVDKLHLIENTVIDKELSETLTKAPRISFKQLKKKSSVFFSEASLSAPIFFKETENFKTQVVNKQKDDYFENYLESDDED